MTQHPRYFESVVNVALQTVGLVGGFLHVDPETQVLALELIRDTADDCINGIREATGNDNDDEHERYLADIAAGGELGGLDASPGQDGTDTGGSGSASELCPETGSSAKEIPSR